MYLSLFCVFQLPFHNHLQTGAAIAKTTCPSGMVRQLAVGSPFQRVYICLCIFLTLAAARDLYAWQPVMRVAAINCGDPLNSGVCKQHGIRGYPTVKVCAN